MKRISSIIPHLTTAGLVAAGLVAYGSAAASLTKNPEMKNPVNPFGIKTSPYGEVVAMAMQAPVDQYWNTASNSTEKSNYTLAPNASFRDRSRFFIETMEAAARDRTNPRPASDAQSRFLKRKIEDKLRFAYELDPAHYANYNTYHFFLTEPAIGTHRQLTREAAELADRTIHYCLSRSDDPRNGLTAAAAAQNMLQLMFEDSKNPSTRFTTAHMRHYLGLMDQGLAHYDAISTQWQKTGNWALLSPQRIDESQDRVKFILKLRETGIKTIERIEGVQSPATSGASTSPSSNP